MNTQIKNTHKSGRKGMALPTVLLIVLFLSLLFIGMQSRIQSFSVNNKSAIINNKYHGLAQSGIEKGAFKWKRPDDTTQAHKWDGSTESFSMTVDGKEVVVTRKDKTRN